MRRAYVHRATVAMAPGADPAAVGAAVTTALCGHWEHPPPCPLAPHHTSAARDDDVVRIRTLFACEPEQENLVRQRIETALSRQEGVLQEATWALRDSGRDDVQQAERAHAARLLDS